ncbi:aldolase/citrate lyase family protein [Microvirga antarctica]|uniref:aldolase/citrate lyase family protein n=1 Tax=Microvirga antarctica TaxID=2819233 RepID=UPI001B306F63|nr:aldolase/citrate lyase family protein [Microvirga antarctica]
MDLPVNAFKRAIQSDHQQIGIWCSLCSNYSTEIIAGSGFDWLLIDMEHSPNEIDTVFNQLQAVAPYPTHPIVRVPWNDMVTVKRLLDIGVQTLLFPYIQNAEEAAMAVAYTRYPPEGVRGVAAAVRANRFGRVRNYPSQAAEELCVLVQIESKAALDQLEAIANVKGVDGVFIGPADLHASFGLNGEVENPTIVPLIENAMRRIRAFGKAPGIVTANEELARLYIEAGCLFTAVGSDVGLLARGSEKLCSAFKDPVRNG